MKKKPKSDKKGGQSSQYRWVVTAFCLAVTLSAALSLASEAVLSGAGLVVALFILAAFILLGIVFDIIGVAVTAADPRPFHSMAAHKVKGAKDSLRLIRNASTVSSVCNDVVGDICGIVSGTTTTVIVVRLQALFDFVPALVLSVGLRFYHWRQGAGQDLCHEVQHHRGGLCGPGAEPFSPINFPFCMGFSGRPGVRPLRQWLARFP